MQPKERQESEQKSLFKAWLDPIRAVDWWFLEDGAVYDDDPGRPPLPTRLMAGLAILKHMLFTRSFSSTGWCSIGHR